MEFGEEAGGNRLDLRDRLVAFVKSRPGLQPVENFGGTVLKLF
jgi:hypothetical protein